MTTAKGLAAKERQAVEVCDRIKSRKTKFDAEQKADYELRREVFRDLIEMQRSKADIARLVGLTPMTITLVLKED